MLVFTTTYVFMNRKVERMKYYPLIVCLAIISVLLAQYFVGVHLVLFFGFFTFDVPYGWWQFFMKLILLVAAVIYFLLQRLKAMNRQARIVLRIYFYAFLVLFIETMLLFTFLYSVGI